MAKRKKSPVKYRRRKKSIGASTGDLLTEIGGIAAGAILAKQLNKMLKFNPRILAAGKLVIGVALPKMVKTPVVKSVGQGMIAVGATELIGSFVPALAGTDDVVLLSGMDEIGELDMMSGSDISEINGLDEIGGSSDISEINGLDEIGEIEIL
jgi:predicted glycosyltransferase